MSLNWSRLIPKIKRVRSFHRLGVGICMLRIHRLLICRLRKCSMRICLHSLELEEHSLCKIKRQQQLRCRICYTYENDMDTTPGGYCMAYPIPKWGALCQAGIIGVDGGYNAVKISCNKFCPCQICSCK